MENKIEKKYDHAIRILERELKRLNNLKNDNIRAGKMRHGLLDAIANLEEINR